MGRRLLKTLRKHQPRDEAAATAPPPMCRRKRHEGRSETCHSSMPAGHYASLTADHVADAIRHATNSQKLAGVGVDLISNFASHFASLLYPEGQGGAAAGPSTAAQAPAAAAAASQPPNSESTSSATTQSVAAATTTPVQPQSVTTPSQPKAATPPVDREMAAFIVDDVDDDEYVRVPISSVAGVSAEHESSSSSVDSVEAALLNAKKDGHL